MELISCYKRIKISWKVRRKKRQRRRKTITGSSRQTTGVRLVIGTVTKRIVVRVSGGNKQRGYGCEFADSWLSRLVPSANLRARHNSSFWIFTASPSTFFPFPLSLATLPLVFLIPPCFNVPPPQHRRSPPVFIRFIPLPNRYTRGCA